MKANFYDIDPFNYSEQLCSILYTSHGKMKLFDHQDWIIKKENENYYNSSINTAHEMESDYKNMLQYLCNNICPYFLTPNFYDINDYSFALSEKKIRIDSQMISIRANSDMANLIEKCKAMYRIQISQADDGYYQLLPVKFKIKNYEFEKKQTNIRHLVSAVIYLLNLKPNNTFDDEHFLSTLQMLNASYSRRRVQFLIKYPENPSLIKKCQTIYKVSFHTDTFENEDKTCSINCFTITGQHEYVCLQAALFYYLSVKNWNTISNQYIYQQIFWNPFVLWKKGYKIGLLNINSLPKKDQFTFLTRKSNKNYLFTAFKKKNCVVIQRDSSNIYERYLYMPRIGDYDEHLKQKYGFIKASDKSYLIFANSIDTNIFQEVPNFLNENEFNPELIDKNVSFQSQTYQNLNIQAIKIHGNDHEKKSMFLMYFLQMNSTKESMLHLKSNPFFSSNYIDFFFSDFHKYHNFLDFLYNAFYSNESSEHKYLKIQKSLDDQDSSLNKFHFLCSRFWDPNNVEGNIKLDLNRFPLDIIFDRYANLNKMFIFNQKRRYPFVPPANEENLLQIFKNELDIFYDNYLETFSEIDELMKEHHFSSQLKENNPFYHKCIFLLPSPQNVDESADFNISIHPDSNGSTYTFESNFQVTHLKLLYYFQAIIFNLEELKDSLSYIPVDSINREQIDELNEFLESHNGKKMLRDFELQFSFFKKYSDLHYRQMEIFPYEISKKGCKFLYQFPIFQKKYISNVFSTTKSGKIKFKFCGTAVRLLALHINNYIQTHLQNFECKELTFSNTEAIFSLATLYDPKLTLVIKDESKCYIANPKFKCKFPYEYVQGLSYFITHKSQYINTYKSSIDIHKIHELFPNIIEPIIINYNNSSPQFSSPSLLRKTLFEEFFRNYHLIFQNQIKVISYNDLSAEESWFIANSNPSEDIVFIKHPTRNTTYIYGSTKEKIDLIRSAYISPANEESLLSDYQFISECGISYFNLSSDQFEKISTHSILSDSTFHYSNDKLFLISGTYETQKSTALSIISLLHG